MSAQCATASSEYLNLDSNVINSDVLSVSVNFQVDSISADNCLFWSGDKDVTNTFFRMMTDATTGTLTYTGRNITSYDATTSNSVSLNTWHNAIGISASATDRRVYLDNGTAGSDTNSVTGIDSVTDRIRFGGMGDSTPGKFLSGVISSCAIWDVALNADERAALASFISPLLVRPSRLVFFMPIYHLNYYDWVGGNVLTANGTPVYFDNPPLIHPGQQSIYTPKAGGIIPLAAYHYNHNVGSNL